jgi:hypothetical protein
LNKKGTIISTGGSFSNISYDQIIKRWLYALNCVGITTLDYEVERMLLILFKETRDTAIPFDEQAAAVKICVKELFIDNEYKEKMKTGNFQHVPVKDRVLSQDGEQRLDYIMGQVTELTNKNICEVGALTEGQSFGE